MAFVSGYGLGNPAYWTDPFANQTRTGQQGQQTGSAANPTSGFQPNSSVTSTGGGAAGIPPVAPNPIAPGSLYGTNNPYHPDAYPIMAPPAAPTADMTQDFLPPLFANPYTDAINNATNLANWYGAATPQAAAWQQQLYGDGMTNMEQTYAGAAAQVGARQLGQTHNRLANMFENSSSHGNLAPAMLDATNQFNTQMNQMIGQMGTQRQGLAANLMPFTAGFPLQASGVGMQGAQGLYDMAQNAMYGDLNFPMAMFGSNPVLLPSTVVT